MTARLISERQALLDREWVLLEFVDETWRAFRSRRYSAPCSQPCGSRGLNRWNPEAKFKKRIGGP